MSFTVDLRSIAEKTNATLDEAARAITISLFNGVIRDTRVDTGRLRGNWQVSLDQPERGTIEREDKVAQGSDGGNAQADVNNTVESGAINYLTNNLPYAEVFEQRDGMVARNAARIQRITDEVARNVRR